MTTTMFFSAPATPYGEPTKATLAKRGRRPALIPYNSDLALSLAAASASLSHACYSPARDEKVTPGMWMFPAEEASAAMPRFVDMTLPAVQTTTAAVGSGKRTPAEEVREDVFSWVNAPETPVSRKAAPQQQLADAAVRYLHTTPPKLDSAAAPTALATRRGTVTRPASPTDAAAQEELERQKRRLDQAEQDVRLR